MSTPSKTLVNAEPVEVEHLDATKESVSLTRLSIRQIYIFAEHVRGNKTPDLVALCTGKPVEWVDSLTPESFAELAGKAVTANFRTAMTIAEKDPVMAIMIGPIVASGVLSVAEMIPAINSQLTTPPAGEVTKSSSQEPAPLASAPASGSASST
jgi:hypothetical protein